MNDSFLPAFLADPWILFTAVGVFVFVIGLREFRHGLQSLRWPCCDGTIIESRVKKSRGARGQETFNPEVLYAYSVEGREYTSRRIAFHGMGGTTRAAADSTCLSYPVGRRVKVFYDRRKPSRATLEVGYGVANAFMIACGAVLAVVGIWNLVRGPTIALFFQRMLNH